MPVFVRLVTPLSALPPQRRPPVLGSSSCTDQAPGARVQLNRRFLRKWLLTPHPIGVPFAVVGIRLPRLALRVAGSGCQIGRTPVPRPVAGCSRSLRVRSLRANTARSFTLRHGLRIDWFAYLVVVRRADNRTAPLANACKLGHRTLKRPGSPGKTRSSLSCTAIPCRLPSRLGGARG